MKERVFETARGQVHYWVSRVSSGSVPWLVFLPGLTADHTLFDAQVSYFAGKVNCLVWDAPAHGASRPYPLDFTMDDLARILYTILAVENADCPVLVGQSLGGYIAQVYMDAHPQSAAGFVAIDSAPLKRSYYPAWERVLLRHTKAIYLSIPWALLKRWGAWGAATSTYGKAQMRRFMDAYTKRAYCELAAHGYRILADAIEADRPYQINCPALLLCGERDRAGDVKAFNRKWAQREGLPLVWVPGAGHNANVDNSAFVNTQIGDFLEQNGVLQEADD